MTKKEQAERLEAIDKAGLAKNYELAEAIHARYAVLAQGVAIEDRFAACEHSKALGDFMGGLRSMAMITYADHGAIIEVVEDDFNRERMENYRSDGVHKIQDHTIHSMIAEKFKGVMVTKNSIILAMESMGYKKTIAKKDGGFIRAWVKKLY